MSRRQRAMRESAQRSRVARAKTLRRRARARRAASAAAAAVTLAGAGTAVASPALAGAADLQRALDEHCDGATTPGSEPGNLTDVDGTLFFTASDAADGLALWRTDGTAAGTVRLKTLGAGDGYYDYGRSSLAEVDGTLFFTVQDDDGDELWKSDGSTSGTVRVKRFPETDDSSYYGGPANLTAVGDTLFFTADDGRHGEELWRSDGTAGGTVLVKDITKGAGDDSYDDYSYGPSDLTDVGGTLFFSASDDAHGQELWRSDGSTAGTVLVKDVHPGSYDSSAEELVGVGDVVFFRARDGVHGQELWRSDGTAAGTSLVKDVRPGAKSGRPTEMVALGDTLFFAAYDVDGTSDEEGRDLWTSDGTEEGTTLVKDFSSEEEYYGVSDLEVVDDRLFFAAPDESHGLELWSTDGSDAGTVLVKDVRAGEYSSYPSELTVVGGDLFFVARDGVHGREVWRSDGTADGTGLVKDIGPGTRERRPSSLTASGGVLYFSADDRAHGEEVWRSDGTADGTSMVKDVNLGGSIEVSRRGDTRSEKGVVKVRAWVDTAGTLEVRPVDENLFKTVVRDLPGADRFTVRLEPTRAGRRALKRRGEVRLRARFTFTSCGGAVDKVTRSYTLKMR